MRVLDLTVLVHEGPMARSYLAMLRSMGCRAKRIVLLTGTRDPANGKPVAPWAPRLLRHPLLRMVQELRMNYWPRELLRRHAALCKPWLAELARTNGLDETFFQSLTERPTYSQHAEQVDEVFCDGLSDPALERHLLRLSGQHTLLFTGGGMVPARLLSLPGTRFIHVHPGVLPQVRGADGLLWSVLLRGRPGATAFYMKPGLDTGDIILSDDLDMPRLPRDLARHDTATAYRMVYAFVDPLLRALMLRRVLQAAAGGSLFTLPAQPQSVDDGATFHFMNPRLRQFAMERMVALANDPPVPPSAVGQA